MIYDIDNLDPAPLNGKDIIEDGLFEQIFDDDNYIQNQRTKPYTVLGFIHGIPCMLEWTFNSNHIDITPLRTLENQSYTNEIIILRITQYNDEPECMTICDTTELSDPILGEYKISADYYYKPDEDEETIL